jgi:ABC-type hemin transport system ATPase subunit
VFENRIFTHKIILNGVCAILKDLNAQVVKSENIVLFQSGHPNGCPENYKTQNISVL